MIVPEYEEFETDDEELEDDEEYIEEPETSTTWILNEKSKTIGKLSDNEKECIAQSARCALRTERGQYDIYPDDYGSELHDLIGETRPHVYARIKHAVAECLEEDDRIDSVDNFDFTDHGDNIAVTFDMQLSDEEDDGDIIEMDEEVDV